MKPNKGLSLKVPQERLGGGAEGNRRAVDCTVVYWYLEWLPDGKLENRLQV